MLSTSRHVVEVPAMGSSMRLVLYGQDAALAAELVEEVARLESLWSRFLETSDISRCNRASGAGAVNVAPDTAAAVALALAFHDETGGRFDPTVLRALQAHGYDATFQVARDRPDRGAIQSAPPGRVPSTLAVVEEAQPAPGCAGIRADTTANTVELPDGVQLDLGGLGKGLAADHIAEMALRCGARGVCVSLGGDIRVAGDGPHGGAWTIDVEDPGDPTSTIGALTLQDGAIVMSTPAIRRWRHGGRWRHHLIDPATGQPAETGLDAVVVTDRTAARAEALAKAAYIAGPEDGARLLEDADVHGWMVSS